MRNAYFLKKYPQTAAPVKNVIQKLIKKLKKWILCFIFGAELTA